MSYIKELAKYYDTYDKENIPKEGFFVQGVAGCLVISENGNFLLIEDLRSDKKNLNLTLPGKQKKTGQGVNPNLYGFDKINYLLGFDKEKKERAIKVHEGFVNEMLKRESIVNNDEFSIFCNFLRKWNIENVDENILDILKEFSGFYLVVRIGRLSKHYLHEVEDLRFDLFNENEEKYDRCSISGKIDKTARTHEKIKGVIGATSSGAGLISFNTESSESYGLKQSYNSGIGEKTAFKYTTALNYLLRLKKNRMFVQNITVVFWSDNKIGEDIFNFGFNNNNNNNNNNNDIIDIKTKKMLQNIKNGIFSINNNENVYILGIIPFVGRISVNLWESISVNLFAKNILLHQNRLNFEDINNIPIWKILSSISEKNPSLTENLFRSIINNTIYPSILLQKLLLKTKKAIVSGDESYYKIRTAMIKAILIKNYERKITMSLNNEEKNQGYLLGRLFSILGHVQKYALGKTNSSVKSYYSSACSTPAMIFPSLMKKAQNHINKLKDGQSFWAESQIGNIVQNIKEFPKTLNLIDQGQFTIGYFHQRIENYKKKEEKE